MEPSPLGFEKADFGDTAKRDLDCSYCDLSIEKEYYEVNGQTACGACRDQYARMGTEGTALGRLFKAVSLGGLGGLIGAGIYYAVLALTGYEIGLVAIAVGFLVGIGVRIGSGGVGGRRYQVLAVAITYLAIVSTYIPFILEELRNMPEEQLESTGASSPQEAPAGEAAAGGSATIESDTLAVGETEADMEMDMEIGLAGFVIGVVLLVLLAMASPFLAGLSNIIGLAIIGFALFEAWRLNAHQTHSIEGPFRLAAPTGQT